MLRYRSTTKKESQKALIFYSEHIMKKTLKLDPLLREILIDKQVHQFTVTELRDHFMDLYQRSTGKKVDSDEVRKWIYRRVYKMAATGYLDKIYSVDGSVKGYKLSEQFFTVKIKDAEHCHLDSLDADDKKSNVAKKVVSPKINKNQDILKSLKEKAKQYQVDLDSSIGETEEYKALYEAYPSLKTQLESQYELSKNKSSKLLGQLTATKKIIDQLSAEHV